MERGIGWVENKEWGLYKYEGVIVEEKGEIK